MRMLRVTALVLSGLFFVMPLQAAAGEPTSQLKTTIDNVLNILRDKELKKPQNLEKRRELIRHIIYSRFDFEEMSKRSLALHWARRSNEEKKEFIPLFSELLERSYINRIEAYTDEEVIYSDELIDNDYAVVKTRIVSKKNVEVPIDYRLMHKDPEWLVYDVIIEGVSLVNNYRTQFNKIINSQSYEELVKKMQSKLEEERALD